MRGAIAGLLAVWLPMWGAGVADYDDDIARLKRLSLQQLLDEKVTTVSRTAERMADTAASIQVITSEDIRRSSATTLPEALRLAPNLQVARVSSSAWAISARGFNNTLANKLLVMIDGRTVYTPLYAGTFWDAQNVLLEDVNRIEVVSGPGGTMWGANAVNGVINVITKEARDTQGTYLSGAAGSFLQDHAAVRYGGGNGSNLFFRAYAQHFDYNATELPNGADGLDSWKMTQGGFRIDWEPLAEDLLTLQGDVYAGKVDELAAETPLDGQNLLGRWTRVLGEESELQVQMYFDRTWRDSASYEEDLMTYDVEMHHRFPLGDMHSILWGAGYRAMWDRINNTSTEVAFEPADKTLQRFNAFLQDEIAVVPDRVKLTLGAKVEYNDYSEIEFQPSGRIAWTPDSDQTLWAAVSRAVRAPSRVDTELFIPAPPVQPGTPNLAGGPDFKSETLVAFDVGYRFRPVEPLSVSLTGFYHIYDDLRSLDQTGTNTFTLGNHFEGEAMGVEVSADYVPTSWWRLRAGYTYLEKELRADGGNDQSEGVREGNDPAHQVIVQSITDLPGGFEVDVTGRYVDELPSPEVPSYFALDARIAWEYKDLEIALVGQNLTESRHREFGVREIPRAVYGRVTLRF